MNATVPAAGPVPSTRRGGSASWTPAVRARIVGWILIVLAIVLVVGPFLWILMNSFKTPIDILSGTWIFTPTLDSYQDVLFSRRSDFVNGLYTSFIVAAASTAIVLVIGTLAAYSLYRFRWAQWVVAGLLGWMLPSSRWSARGISCSRNWACTTRARHSFSRTWRSTFRWPCG
jgi:multiple sugar transport system permease protein